jgi:hypothetical protein
MAGIAAGLIILATPRFCAALAAIPGDPILDRIALNEPVSIAELTIAEASRHRMLHFVESAKAWSDLSIIHLARWTSFESGSSQGEILLSRSLDEAEMSVQLEPANGFSTARCAYLLVLKGEKLDKAATLLSRSLNDAPRDPRLSYMRIWLATALREKFSQFEHGALNAEIVEAYRRQPWDLIRLAKQAGIAPIIDRALEDNQAEQSAFRANLAGIQG